MWIVRESRLEDFCVRSQMGGELLLLLMRYEQDKWSDCRECQVSVYRFSFIGGFCTMTAQLWIAVNEVKQARVGGSGWRLRSMEVRARQEYYGQVRAKRNERDDENCIYLMSEVRGGGKWPQWIYSFKYVCNEEIKKLWSVHVAHFVWRTYFHLLYFTTRQSGIP